MGRTHVVAQALTVLSVLLPMIVTGVTAYAVHKAKAFREMKLETHISRFQCSALRSRLSFK